MANKQEKLFDTPRNAPTRQQRIKAFKAKHDIETHNAGPGWAKKDHPWSAYLMPLCRQMGQEHGLAPDAGIDDLMAHLCRLLDEAGLVMTGETERDAIRRLCEKNSIPFDP